MVCFVVVDVVSLERLSAQVACAQYSVTARFSHWPSCSTVVAKIGEALIRLH